MFGAKPEEQRAYEERHPVLGAYYRAPRAEREAAAREHARRKAAERRTRKDS